MRPVIDRERVRFQSTQPEWAATRPSRQLSSFPPRNFNPRSPNGLRRSTPHHNHRANGHFNPRSPNGLRLTDGGLTLEVGTFQSTQPEWAATRGNLLTVTVDAFQSTQPEWAATDDIDNFLLGVLISIHAARMGCDRGQEGRRHDYRQNFNPRSPNGLRPEELVQVVSDAEFQSTQPEWAATG